MDVGKVEKQRWNGCPTGDGRVESSCQALPDERTGISPNSEQLSIRLDNRLDLIFIIASISLPPRQSSRSILHVVDSTSVLHVRPPRQPSMSLSPRQSPRQSSTTALHVCLNLAAWRFAGIYTRPSALKKNQRSRIVVVSPPFIVYP